jgi:hypothetical protein
MRPRREQTRAVVATSVTSPDAAPTSIHPPRVFANPITSVGQTILSANSLPVWGQALVLLAPWEALPLFGVSVAAVGWQVSVVAVLWMVRASEALGIWAFCAIESFEGRQEAMCSSIGDGICWEWSKSFQRDPIGRNVS